MKQFVRYYLRIKSKCMKVTYLFNFIILILLGSCISKELIKEAKERMDTAGNATKRMLQCFLEVFNIL